MIEPLKLPYGQCPYCGEMRQPDCIACDDYDEEYVECEDCGIAWTLHHDDPNDKHDETEPWRTYRITDIEPL